MGKKGSCPRMVGDLGGGNGKSGLASDSVGAEKVRVCGGFGLWIVEPQWTRQRVTRRQLGVHHSPVDMLAREVAVLLVFSGGG